MKEIKLRRSSSERKLTKNKKKERKEKSQSAHFENNEVVAMQPISIIGNQKVSPPAGSEESTPLTPPSGEINAEDSRGKKNNKFIWTLKVFRKFNLI